MTVAEAVPSARMWDQLRRDARKLEGELEMKLAQLSRLCSGLDSTFSAGSDSTRAQQSAGQMSLDVTNLLKRLGEVHTAMEADVRGSDVRQHTIARHRDIMQDYSQEFRRLSSQINQVCYVMLHSCVFNDL
jgi:golgi SNAP receptor complex member 1